MKLLRKLIVTPLILSLLAACFCLHASAMVIYDGDFGFEVNASKNEAKLVKYIGNGGAVTLPAYYRDYPVTVIDRNAFSGNTAITELVFSETNTTVAEYAFMSCTSLNGYDPRKRRQLRRQSVCKVYLVENCHDAV